MSLRQPDITRTVLFVLSIFNLMISFVFMEYLLSVGEPAAAAC
jgi:hypothetical protein